MGRIVGIILLLLVIWYALSMAASGAGTPPESGRVVPVSNQEPRLTDAIEDIFDLASRGFTAVAELNRSVQNTIWENTPVGMRPLLGVLRCLEFLLAVLGLFSLRALGRFL